MHLTLETSGSTQDVNHNISGHVSQQSINVFHYNVQSLTDMLESPES